MPDSISDYFEYKMSQDRNPVGDRVVELMLHGGKGSHQEVVETLLEAFKEARNKSKTNIDKELFGGEVTYLWQELKNRIEEPQQSRL